VAGDPRVPRLLTGRRHAALVAVLALVAGCNAQPPSRDDRTPSSRPAEATRVEARHADLSDAEVESALARVAWARVRLSDGRTIEAHASERLDEPVHPGSLFKVIAARAASEQGLATTLRVACPRRVEIAGRRVDCVHPDLGRPLGLEDALAQSCNHYFVRLASALDRRQLESSARALLGQVFHTGDAPLPLVVLGLEGPQFGLRTWARAAVVASASTGGDRTAHARLLDGLRMAATDGTAAALRDGTTLTLAKTGTTVPPSGGAEGVVVAWRPESQELVMVRAPGASGRDAAGLAQAIWDRAARAADARVRVGVTARDRDAGVPPQVSSVPLETYVAGVVAGEAEATASPASLHALAIAARSYARAPDGRHAADGYDVCDTTHCQRLVPSTGWSQAAAAATRGLVLTRGHATVAVPYSATCSGNLVAPSDVWGGPSTGDLTLVGPDPGPHAVPAWRSEVGVEDLARAMAHAGHRGEGLRDVRIVGRTRGGRPARVALDGLTPGEIDAAAFRHVIGRVLGWDVLKSHEWDVRRVGRGFRFDGHGKGHGVGLCVRGADALGRGGRDAVDILKTYAPGARLRAGQDRITVRAPAAWTGELERLDATVRSLMADTRLRLGVVAPRRLDVRLHATIEAYQRATGRAWWTAGSTRRVDDGGWRIDLAPPAGRPSITSVDGTLRHELVHVLTADVLSLAPAWAAEGLATLVGRRRPGSGPVEAAAVRSCPADHEVTRPGDAARLREAYGAAAACAGAALPGGPAAWRSLVGR
jgi:stage II sporulation protein D